MSSVNERAEHELEEGEKKKMEGGEYGRQRPIGDKDRAAREKQEQRRNCEWTNEFKWEPDSERRGANRGARGKEKKSDEQNKKKNNINGKGGTKERGSHDRSQTNERPECALNRGRGRNCDTVPMG